MTIKFPLHTRRVLLPTWIKKLAATWPHLSIYQITQPNPIKSINLSDCSQKLKFIKNLSHMIIQNSSIKINKMEKLYLKCYLKLIVSSELISSKTCVYIQIKHCFNVAWSPFNVLVRFYYRQDLDKI